MNPKLPTLLTLLLTLIVMGCAPEDNSVPVENVNKFSFNGETYNLISAIITDQNTTTNSPSNISIRLFNKTSTEATGNSDLTDVTFVYFNVEDINLQATTYNNIENYDVSINGSIVNSEFDPGTILLSDNDSESDVFAQSGIVTITNFTQYNIDFTFTFTRNDGEILSGRYNGNYLAANTID